jgi:hypothetical protein
MLTAHFQRVVWIASGKLRFPALSVSVKWRIDQLINPQHQHWR